MTTTESLFDEIERNNIEVYLGSMPAAKSASANIGDDYYIALDEQSLLFINAFTYKLLNMIAIESPFVKDFRDFSETLKGYTNPKHFMI